MAEQKKLRPLHILLIVVMLVLTIGVYHYKDKIMPDLNAPYREQMSGHIETGAEVISKETERGRRGSRTIVTVQFEDREGTLRTARLDDNGLQSVSRGDSITVYYNPENPKEARSEAAYKEIMKIK